MKYALSLSVTFFLGLTLFGQSITLNVLRKADDAFDKFSYYKAVEYYKLALENEESSYIVSQIALSYKNLNNQDSAEVWLKKAIDKGEKDPEFNFYLAEALLFNQKVEEAKYWYQEYSQKVENDGRSEKKLAAIANYDEFFKRENQVQIELIKDNSLGLDFSPAFYKNGLVFVSSRPRSAWVSQEFNWDQSSFLDYHYVAHQDSAAIYLEDGLNTKYHEGPLVEFNNRQSVAYTRNNFDGRKLRKDQKGVTNLKLYFAEWDSTSGKWINETPFQYNSDEYSIGSPAISQDGSVLVFASNMQGSFGASDLFVSYKEANGWSVPQNLGDQVNSKGRDNFPFIYNDILYFSSDGREGLGGLDIYQIEFNGKEVKGEAENIGSPINSNKDDFGLIRSGDTGYFASNRSTKTMDDIFKYYLKDPELILISGEVYDVETNEPVVLSDVFLKLESGDFIYTRSKGMGKYEAMVPVNSVLTISAGKFAYDLVSNIEMETNEGDAIAERIYLKKVVTIEPDTTSIPNIAEVVDKRIPPYEETGDFVDSLAVGDTVRLDIVYYDLDKSFQRTDSKVILDKIANFMIEHVDVKAVLASHTDARSSNAYNLRLSQRRSNSTEDYLIYMGANPNKIEKVNYGEEILVNDCENNVDCLEKQHQLNRRTEIYLIKIEEESD